MTRRFLIAGLLLASAVHAEEGGSFRPSADGSLRAGLWSSDRQLSDHRGLAAASFWAKADLELPLKSAVHVDGFVADDHYAGDGPNGLLREFYISTTLPFGYLRLGRQIISWGRADKLNPTDNLSPRDFTTLAVEDDDQRFGTFSTSLNIDISQANTLALLWLPEFEANRLPVARQTGMILVEHEPSHEKARRQYALKFDHGGSVDWSLSFAQKYDLNPDLALASAGPQGLVIAEGHHRLRIYGLDGASSAGPYAFRLEAAFVDTQDGDGSDAFAKNPFWYGVAGVERSMNDGLSLILQLWARHVQDFKSPDIVPLPALRPLALQQAVISQQLHRDSQGLSWRIARKWFNDTLEGEFSGIYGFNDDDRVLRLKGIYALSDKIRFSLGGEVFRGPQASFYGRLRDNSLAYLEARYSF